MHFENRKFYIIMNDFTGSTYILVYFFLPFLFGNNSIWIPKFFGSHRVTLHLCHHVRGREWRLYVSLSLVKLELKRRMKLPGISSMGEKAGEIPEFFLYSPLGPEQKGKVGLRGLLIYLLFPSFISHLYRLSLLLQGQTMKEWQGTQRWL